MKKNDFIYPAVFLGIALLLFAIPIGAFLTSEVLGFETARSIGSWIYKFLKDHGGLIGSIFGAIVLAVTVYFTLKKQSENVRDQISAQRLLEEMKLIREKIEEIYSIVSKLRLKMLFTRAKFNKAIAFDRDIVFDRDIISDIDIFNYDLDKILMLYNLYGNYNLYASIDECLFSEYRGSVRGLLDNWKEVVQKLINVIDNTKEDIGACMDAEVVYKESFKRFEEATNNLIIHLSSIGKKGNINIIRSVE